MKPVRNFIVVLLIALAFVTSLRTGRRLIAETAQNGKISEICGVVAGEMQIGSYPRAIESANSLFISAFPEVRFRVQIKEGATVFGAGISSSDEHTFRKTACEIAARSNLTLSFFIEKQKIFNDSFLPSVAISALIFWVLGLLTVLASRNLSAFAQKRFNLEIQKSLGLITELPSKGLLGRWLENVVQGGGTGDNLRESVQLLMEKIKDQQREFVHLREIQVRNEFDLKRNEKFIDVVRQVRHDIRGPLQTLLVMMEEKSGQRFEKRRIGAIVANIQGMIEDLEIKEEMEDASRSGEVSHVGEALIKEVIQQKRLLFGSTDVELEIKSEFLSVVRVQPHHFRRLISNILQNAFEAMTDRTGKIRVLTDQKDGYLRVVIQDDGCGIPAAIKPALFAAGFTHGKARGSGLGLSHAKSCVVRWGGDIQIESTEDIGTAVTISLPLTMPNARFIAKSPLANAEVNVVVDDEIESFEKIQAALPGPSVYCQSLAEFENWRSAFGSSEGVQFVFDYNLKEAKTGLDVLRGIESTHPKVLATNDYDRSDVIEASCNGIYVLPKVFLA